MSAGDDSVVADSGGAARITTDVDMSIGDVPGTTLPLVDSDPGADRTATYGEYTAE